MVEGLASAEAEGGFALLGLAGGEVADASSSGNAVGVLLVVELEVGFGAVRELVADEEAAPPALRRVAIAEVVADFAVDANGAEAGR